MYCRQVHSSLFVTHNILPVAVRLCQKDACRRTGGPAFQPCCTQIITHYKLQGTAMFVVLAQQLMSVRLCLQILLTQQQLMKAKSDEENKGGGAADARRWNGLRNVVESRALLKTAFRTASTLKAQVDCSSALSMLAHHAVAHQPCLMC